MTIQPDTFAYAGVDMLATYGIRCSGYSFDTLTPKLRPRKITVPGKSGTRDFGAKHYEDRALRIQCDAMERRLDRHEIRELAYLLSKKGRIVLWDEPDKYYVGRLYDAAELKYIGMVGHEFSLTFICEPFAYGRTYSGPMPERFVGDDAYLGTATTPTRIQVTNTGQNTIPGFRIIIREERTG